MTHGQNHYLANEDETRDFAARLRLPAAGARLLVALQGDLGAGKTSFVRGFLRGLGWRGAVKSPTYTLVEPYAFGEQLVCHFDLYRLGDPDELEFIGIRDYLDEATLCFVEWPERGAGALPAPDLTLWLSAENAGRRLSWQADTAAAQQWVAVWAATADTASPAPPGGPGMGRE